MNEKKNIIMFSEKKDCCGCAACFSICQLKAGKAIEMEEDHLGNIYPKINNNLCIRCKLCLKVCPLKRG